VYENIGRSQGTDYFSIADQLTPAELDYLRRVRDFVDGEVFSSHFEFLPEDAVLMLYLIGQPFERDDLLRLKRAIHRCLLHNAGPWPIARLIAREVRALAGRNQYVGKNLMCNIVRRPSGGLNESYVSGMVPLPHILDFGKDGALFPGLWREDQTKEKVSFQLEPGIDQYYIYWPESVAQQVHYGPNLAGAEFCLTGTRFGPSDLIQPES
jgi:hypothetical protein